MESKGRTGNNFGAKRINRTPCCRLGDISSMHWNDRHTSRATDRITLEVKLTINNFTGRKRKRTHADKCLNEILSDIRLFLLTIYRSLNTSTSHSPGTTSWLSGRLDGLSPAIFPLIIIDWIKLTDEDWVFRKVPWSLELVISYPGLLGKQTNWQRADITSCLCFVPKRPQNCKGSMI